MSKETVALLGVGTMGSGMAANLLKGGFSLRVFNRTRAKAEPLAALGAVVVDTAEEASRGADVVISMLSDDHASREAWLSENGALRGMSPQAVAVESSTVTPQWLGELKTQMDAAGIAFVDAPVTGSRPQATEGKLSFLVGGEAATLERVRSVLESMSQKIIHVGPFGSGARLKLINNFLCGAQLASIAEAMSWMERSGLNREAAWEFLRGAAPGSPMLGGIADRMMKATYEVNFLLPLMKKDMEYATADARTFGLELRSAQAPESRLSDAVAAGLTDKDMSAVVEPLRDQAKSKREASQ